MDGWKTKLAMWRESMPENRFRPAGLTSLLVTSSPLAAWQRKTPFEKLEKSGALLSSWEITIAREFSFDDTVREWMAGLCDSVASDSEAPQTSTGALAAAQQETPPKWTIETELPDGSAKRYTGLALKKWELIIQSGRIVSETLTFTALSCVDIESVDAVAPNRHAIVPARISSMRVDDALPEVTGATWPGGGSLVFSTQIIFERTLAACNYRNRGDAVNHQCGPWEITGQNVCRLTPAQFRAAVGVDVEAALFWKVTHPLHSECSFEIAMPCAVIRVRRQEQIAGEIEHLMDFHGMNSSGTAAFLNFKA